VLVDPASGDARALVARTDTGSITPSWTPDSSTVLFAADIGDAPFNAYAAVSARATCGGRTRAAWPAPVSPNWRPSGSLVYLGYTPDGYDICSRCRLVRLQADATGR
jgi:Tol biopolymer transport system component